MKTFSDQERFKALSTLSKHIGRQKAIPMSTLYEKVFDTPPVTSVNGTRKLRRLITELRSEGEPICSTTGGGYYLAAVGSELDEYCERLKKQAVRKLRIVSKIMKISLRELNTQLDFHFDNRSSHVE